MTCDNKTSDFDFWDVKHQIDNEVARLGWSKGKCTSLIINRYSKISRLVMTDEQLLDLLDYLKQQQPRLTPLSRQTGSRKASRRKRR